MLGRQQIASLPTALSELFKNSYDAYATVAIADFFRSGNVLVVSDDGLGMDRATFEEHWLTIATESKLERGSTQAPPGMRTRIQLGEKGIGRLAIGALGSQVLVVSKRNGHPAVGALVNWKMFELPRVDLDEVPVGLVELNSGDLTADRCGPAEGTDCRGRGELPCAGHLDLVVTPDGWDPEGSRRNPRGPIPGSDRSGSDPG